MFDLITKAYKVLSDEDVRAAYDSYGHQGCASGIDAVGPLGCTRCTGARNTCVYP